MPRKRTNRPAYRHYRPKNLAVVRIDGKDHYLGPYGSEASYERYHRLIAEWLARSASGVVPASAGLPAPPALTISELIWRYWQFVRAYYRKNDEPTSEQHCIRSALRPLRRLFGRTTASEFGPKSLKIVREDMVASGLCRTTINKYVHRIKRLFAWGVEQELIDVRIYQALATVRGLAKGRTAAAERPPVRPVTPEQINATLPHVSPVLRAMIRFQRLTGCRPTEACLLRPCDVDLSGQVWCYRPASHKTEHHGMERWIFIGTAAQQVLQPFLDRAADAFCFSPQGAHGKWLRQSSASRRPGNRYTSASYRRAIARGCEIAFDMPKELRVIPKNVSVDERARLEAEAASWRQEHCWAPNQLRHLRGTEIRGQFGLEAAQVVLGHARADVSQLYAERNVALAKEIARQSG
jgi:integrase